MAKIKKKKKEMLNMPSPKGNANKNYIKILFHSC
jgi:hypothetical protein